MNLKIPNPPLIVIDEEDLNDIRSTELSIDDVRLILQDYFEKGYHTGYHIYRNEIASRLRKMRKKPDLFEVYMNHAEYHYRYRYNQFRKKLKELEDAEHAAGLRFENNRHRQVDNEDL